LDGDEALLPSAHRCVGARARGSTNGRPKSVVFVGRLILRAARSSASAASAAAYLAKRAVCFTVGFLTLVGFDFEIAVDLVLSFSRLALLRDVRAFLAGDVVIGLPMSGSETSSWSCSSLA
jgi:hypothetical protein